MFSKKIIPCIIIVVVQIFISCKEEKKVKQHMIIQKPIEYTVEFPDTVTVNELNDGIVRYKSKLDTIITSFGDRKKNRYTRFILTATKNPNYDFKHLKKTVRDTFGAINNRKIPFYSITFSKSGVYYLDGIINDIILIDLNKKDEQGNDLSRFIEQEERVTKKVVVIDK
jgi:hypothetical protein